MYSAQLFAGCFSGGGRRWRSNGGALQMDNWYKALENLVWVGQLGFSLLFPLVCFLVGCWWLTTHMGVGGWVYIPGILLGLATGAATFGSFAKRWQNQANRDSKQRPGGFNKH